MSPPSRHAGPPPSTTASREESPDAPSPRPTHASQPSAAPVSDSAAPRIACDAMCGGLARWLRAIGADAWYVTGVTDSELVRVAIRERRIIVSSDGPLFERRVLARGDLRGVRLPVGLGLLDQVRFVVRELRLSVGFPRCTLCNGALAAVRRDEVGDVVPARSLIWAREFFRCELCGHVFWEGTHWRRIGAVRDELARCAAGANGANASAALEQRAGRHTMPP